MKFWSPNLEARGRLARAIIGTLLLLGALLTYFLNGSAFAAVCLAIGGAFCLFEAARGWCAFRACGLKTPL